MEIECETKPKELHFYGCDPGAVKFGNFINYYSFHDVQQRLNNLRPHIFPKPVNDRIVCLDVGCNTGDLTVKLYEYLRNIYIKCDIRILAIDIDSTLIQRAQESNKYPEFISFVTANIMEEDDLQHIHNFLETYERKTFDVTFCFSVIMWIHINNGDEGLLEFLKFLKNVSKTIVIEPQPWKCYRNAQRRMRKSGKSFEHYKTLKIKNNVDLVIETFLKENFFNKIYESQRSSWNRKIVSFQRMDVSIFTSLE